MQLRNILPAAILLASQGVQSAPAPVPDAAALPPPPPPQPAPPAAGPPTAPDAPACRNPLVRKEWRTLTKPERLAYINAVKCHKSKPAKTTATWAGAKSRYDDFQALHITMTERIHFVGQFLPYHRQLLAIYEAELRTTCGYKGAQPYWDWTKDSKDAQTWNSSPVFDNTYGFGGNGEFLEDITGLPITSLAPGPLEPRTGGGCVTTGPFANTQVPMGPGNSTAYTPHCLRRDLIPSFASLKLSQGSVDLGGSAPSFDVYTRRIEAVDLNPDLSGLSTHGGGHFGVGGMAGQMSDMYSSPGDPLFWMHHAALDYQCNKWQRLSWPARKSDIGGPDTMWAYPYNFMGDVPYSNITLDFALEYPLMAPTVPIRDVMDISGGHLCYRYT